MFDLILTGLKEFPQVPLYALLPRIHPRDSETQKRVDEQCARQLELWAFYTSPYCLRVFRAQYRLRLTGIKRVFIDGNRPLKRRLLKEGGTFQVPALRIEAAPGQVRWLYESKDIVKYLEEVARAGTVQP